ncbi:MAG: GTPase HflX [Actinomycetia bacterium]|nr:GTPase HflX [Actinomycetes bacterium]
MAPEIRDARLRALLVGVDSGASELWSFDDTFDELRRLALTADLQIAGRLSQKLPAPHNVTYLGKGKTEELRQLVSALEAEVVLFDDELTPRQETALTRLLPDSVMVVDRTALILSIFADHATSREGKLQVELAQLEYELPRLRGKWSHLTREKLGGASGARFGAGESQLESDRRLIRRRIALLRKKIEAIGRERRTQRQRRSSSAVFRIVLVGYTNAGKSTLLNRLSSAEVLAYDKLFATLDATTRRIGFEGGRQATLTDTVGFIHKLPHTLVASFRSTLDEVREADLLLHVVDAASPVMRAQIAAVQEVLVELGAEGKPQLLVLNKGDEIAIGEAEALKERWPGSLVISALRGEGIDELRRRLSVLSERSAGPR